MGFGSQVKYLLYRNFLLKRRNSKQTIYEAVSVLYFVAILAVIRQTAVKPKVYKATTDADLPTFAVFPHHNASFFLKPPKEIGYVLLPNSSQQATREFLKKLVNITGSFNIKLSHHSDEAALEDAHKAAPKNLTLGLVIKINATKKEVDYTIKVPYQSVPLTTSDKRRDQPNGIYRILMLMFLLSTI